MRMVKVTIVYDMDDEDKSLEAERQDWLKGNVTVEDIVNCDNEEAITIALV